MNAMTRKDFAAAMRRLSLPYGVLFFAVAIPGVVGALYGADRVAGVSSWPRELVFLAMLPVFLAPMILGGWVVSIVDRGVGLKCYSCGGSLSMGRHVRRLLRCGGACPKCGALVVHHAGNAEPCAPPNGGPARSDDNSNTPGGPPSVS
jgi:hypothetical protein